MSQSRELLLLQMDTLKMEGRMGPGLLGSWACILSASMRWDGSGAVDGVWAGLWGS